MYNFFIDGIVNMYKIVLQLIDNQEKYD